MKNDRFLKKIFFALNKNKYKGMIILSILDYFINYLFNMVVKLTNLTLKIRKHKQNF